jgi:hypothetical protein
MNKLLSIIAVCCLLLLPKGVMADSCASLNGQDDKKLREYSLRYTQSVFDEIRRDIQRVSQQLYGRSVEVFIDFTPSKRCVATPYVQAQTIRVPPIFLELLMLKAEDMAIVDHMVLQQIAPKLLVLTESELDELGICMAHVLNYNHVRKPGSIAELCGDASKNFFDAFRHVRKNAQTWSVAIDFFYDALYMSLAHEYAHIFLGHDRSTLSVEDEIDADVMAVELFSEGKPTFGDVLELKTLFSTSAALIDFRGMIELTGLPQGEQIEVNPGTVAPQVDNYLSSECRGYEVMKRLKLDDKAQGEFRETQQQMADILPPRVLEGLGSSGLFQVGVFVNCE